MPSLIAGFPPARLAGSGSRLARGDWSRASRFSSVYRRVGAGSFWCEHQPEAARPCCCAHGFGRRPSRIDWRRCRSGEVSGMPAFLAAGDRCVRGSDRRGSACCSGTELPREAVVDRLLADLELLEEKAVLVIDDLHELDSGDASAWLETFLARRPASLRVVLATREDPRLGLHRVRLAGELTELRTGCDRPQPLGRRRARGGGPPPRARLARDLDGRGPAGDVPLQRPDPGRAGGGAACTRTHRARPPGGGPDLRCQCTFADDSFAPFPATGSG